VTTQKAADGVWYLTGGTHHSVVIEMKDYTIVVEAPLNEERSVAVIAETKKLVPAKPIHVASSRRLAGRALAHPQPARRMIA